MDFRYSFIYTAVNVFCILASLIILSKLSYNIGSERQVRIFRLMTAAFIGFLLCELVWGLAIGELIPIPLSIASSLRILSTLLIPLMVYFWFLFAEIRFGSTWPNKPVHLVLAAIPFIALVAVYIATYGKGIVFDVGPDGQLLPGPAAGLTGLVDNIYGIAIIVHGILLAIREKAAFRRKEYFTQIVFILLCTAGGLIDAAVSNTPVMPLAITLSYIFLLTNIQESQIYNDALTGMNNRRRGDHFLNDAISDVSVDDPFYLFLIDINRFKHINDSRGHLEGDRVLQTVASALGRTINEHQGFAARWGGDEFLAIIESSDSSLPERFSKALSQSLQEELSLQDLDYEVTVSMGYALCNSKDTRMNDLIAQADAMLYQQKALLAEQV